MKHRATLMPHPPSPVPGLGTVPGMQQRLSPATALLLTIPPLMWASNAIVGRLVWQLIPPVMLNFLRWVLVFFLLLPLAHRVLRADSGVWAYWRRFALLGLLSVGCYNALQYLALETSSPINVTLVSSSMPVWMLAIGGLFFGTRITRRQVWGAGLSIVGVLVVLCRGDWHELLGLRLVVGDLYMLLATVAWSFYSWLLTQPKDPPGLRADWASFLMVQVVFGLLWAGSFAAGEHALVTSPPIAWGWPLVAALAYVAAGPSLLAYQCWNVGVRRVGPSMAGFFANLAPLFAALLSAAFLGDAPRLYHAFAFALIVGGIVVSSQRSATRTANA